MNIFFYACYNYHQERERTGRRLRRLLVHFSFVDSHDDDDDDDDVQDSSPFFFLSLSLFLHNSEKEKRQALF
jgi:hypothetical protein